MPSGPEQRLRNQIENCDEKIKYMQERRALCVKELELVLKSKKESGPVPMGSHLPSFARGIRFNEVSVADA